MNQFNSNPEDYEVDYDDQNPDQPDNTEIIGGSYEAGFLTEEEW